MSSTVRTVIIACTFQFWLRLWSQKLHLSFFSVLTPILIMTTWQCTTKLQNSVLTETAKHDHKIQFSYYNLYICSMIAIPILFRLCKPLFKMSRKKPSSSGASIHLIGHGKKKNMFVFLLQLRTKHIFVGIHLCL